MKIRTKILATFLTAFLATMGLVTALAHRLSGAALQTMVTARLERVGRAYLANADIRIQQTIHNLEAWSQRSDLPPQVIVGDVDGVVGSSLRDLQRLGGFAGAIECADRHGKVIACTDPRRIGQVRDTADWFRAGANGQPYVSELKAVAGTDAHSFIIACPISSISDEAEPGGAPARAPAAVPPEPVRRTVGVVMAEVDWEVAISLLITFEDEEHANGFKTTELEVANTNGVIQASHDRGDILRNTLHQSFGFSAKDFAANAQLQRTAVDQNTDQEVLLVMVRSAGSGYISSRGWIVVARQSSTEAFAPSRALLLWVSLLSLVVTILLGSAGAIALGRMVSPIQSYVGFAEQLGRGELGEALTVTGHDDLAALGVSLNQMRAQVMQRADDLQRRAVDLAFQDRCKQQINQLSNRLQGAQDLVTAAQVAIAEIAPLTRAALGAIYIRESLVRHGGRAELLQLLGGYALGAGDGAQSTIEVGCGLVGQCAQLGRRIEVETVPADYVRIQSGLGAASPTSLVLAPVMQEGQLIGVVELAACAPFRPELLTFLDQLLATLGVVLENIASRARTERLLFESRELGERLRRQSEALAQSSRYKSEFLANMSHELRTPLNSLLILSNLLGKNKTGNLTAQQVDYALTINAAGSDLLNLINQILDLSKIEAGKMTLSISTFRFKEVKQGLETAFRLMAEERRINLQIELQPELPASMSSDQVQLLQILKNIISNALKFTESGNVTVRIGREPTGPQPLFFAVEDTGIGIPPEKLELIFEAFQQADGTTSRKYGGTGLGLSISKELARLLGGYITVSSEVNQGSTFTLHLPPEHPGAAPEADVPAVSAPPVTAAAPVPLVPRRALVPPPIPAPARSNDRTLLIIEDDPAFAELLAKLGRERGYKILMAAAADSGLSLAFRYLPDAILLDVNLPRPDGASMLDGWGVLERVKSFPATRHIPVHVISILKDLDLGLKLGAVEVHAKPLSPGDLESLYVSLEEFQSRQPGRLLLLEPDAPTSGSIKVHLEHTDIVVTTVATAAAARTALERAPHSCLVINAESAFRGDAELLASLMQHPVFRRLPTIVFTGRTLDATEQAQLQRFARYLIIHHASSLDHLRGEASVFLHRVESQLPTSMQSPQGLLPEEAISVVNQTALVVDDDERNVFALSEMLKGEGMKVLTARNGAECMELMAKHPAVDVVLMDTMMPEMDGHECTRQIRLLPECRSLPIIAVTAKAMLGDRQACLDAGANDYLTKPVDAVALLNQIRTWIYLCPQLPGGQAT